MGLASTHDLGRSELLGPGHGAVLLYVFSRRLAPSSVWFGVVCIWRSAIRSIKMHSIFHHRPELSCTTSQSWPPKKLIPRGATRHVVPTRLSSLSCPYFHDSNNNIDISISTPLQLSVAMAVTALPRPPGSGPFSQNPSEFSALFPPIIDIQTHEAITNRAAAAHAGHAPPAFTVPHLVSPEPSFALPDLDGDAQGHERVLATLDHGSANDFGNEEDAISAQLREDLPRTATPDRGHSSGASSPSITTPTRFQNIWQLAAQPEEDGERAFEVSDLRRVKTDSTAE